MAPSTTNVNSPASHALFSGGVHAVNVGVAEFGEAPGAHGATITQLDTLLPRGLSS